MASFSTLRAFLPAAHGFSAVPVAALKAAATSSASFVVVCPAGRRSADVAAALQAATNGSGLIFSSRMVARAAKRSGGVEDGRTGEDSEEVGAGDDGTANLFFVGAFDDLPGGGGEDIKAENVAGEDIKAENVVGGDIKAENVVSGGEDIKAENVGGDYTVNTKAKDEDTKAKDDVGFAYGEMTMDELVVMFHKETASLLRQAKNFPVGDDENNLASLVAACNAVGEQIHKTEIMDSPEGRTAVQSLITLHLRMVSCAGGAMVWKRGSSMPDIWSGYRHRLPCKEKRAGTLMELLLYSMMLAEASLDRFIDVTWDFTVYG